MCSFLFVLVYVVLLVVTSFDFVVNLGNAWRDRTGIMGVFPFFCGTDRKV